MASRLEYYLGTGAAKSIYSEARNNTYSDAAQRRRAASMDRSTYDIAGEDGGVGMLGAGVKNRRRPRTQKIAQYPVKINAHNPMPAKAIKVRLFQTRHFLALADASLSSKSCIS